MNHSTVLRVKQILLLVIGVCAVGVAGAILFEQLWLAQFLSIFLLFLTAINLGVR